MTQHLSAKALGGRMKAAREARSLTQGEVLGKMRWLERKRKKKVTIGQSGWSKVERGDSWPSLQLFSLFCRALKVSSEDLL